jgi:hypothetical protein
MQDRDKNSGGCTCLDGPARSVGYPAGGMPRLLNGVRFSSIALQAVLTVSEAA